MMAAIFSSAEARGDDAALRKTAQQVLEVALAARAGNKSAVQRDIGLTPPMFYRILAGEVAGSSTSVAKVLAWGERVAKTPLPDGNIDIADAALDTPALTGCEASADRAAAGDVPPPPLPDPDAWRAAILAFFDQRISVLSAEADALEARAASVDEQIGALLVVRNQLAEIAL